MKNIHIPKGWIYLGFLSGGLFMGWLIFHHPEASRKLQVQESQTSQKIWTCAMHPHIRMEKPGKCPLCAMDLIPVSSLASHTDSAAVQLSPEAIALANVMTTVVKKQKVNKEIRLYGKIQADERSLRNQTAHFPGRVESLNVNFTGETVTKGQVLGTIYSPELVTAQQELLETIKTKLPQPELYEAAKERLRQWLLTDEQIATIEKTGIVMSRFTILSGISGTVITRRVNQGDYVSQGSILFDIADLSNVWAQFDAYESDLWFLKTGSQVKYTFQAFPGKQYTGIVKFIDPVIDPVTHIAKVRVEVNNPDGRIKPEMLITGIIKADLPDIESGMVVPQSAVLWTGKRSLVYVKKPGTKDPAFKVREVTLGPMLGNSYLVNHGLDEGEEIITQGIFNVDASAQLEGKPSMMNFSTSVSQEQSETTTPEIQTVTFKVSGNCDMCKERIEKTASSMNGVTQSKWNKDTKLLKVSFHSKDTNQDKIQMAIAKAGHDTEKYKAGEKEYQALPDCCHYR